MYTEEQELIIITCEVYRTFLHILCVLIFNYSMALPFIDRYKSGSSVIVIGNDNIKYIIYYLYAMK